MQHDITPHQAIVLLVLQGKGLDIAPHYTIMARGIDGDWENWTEVCPEDIECVVEGMYQDYQLWERPELLTPENSTE